MIAKSRLRLWRLFLNAILFFSATWMAAAQVAPPPPVPSASGQPWSVSYREVGGVAGPTLSLQLGEKGLVRFSSRFPSATLCFRAPQDQVRQLTSSIKEISSAQPSRQSPQKQPVPDTPSSSVELTYGSKSFSTGDYAG